MLIAELSEGASPFPFICRGDECGEVAGEHALEVRRPCHIFQVNGEISDIEPVAEVEGLDVSAPVELPHVHGPVGLVAVPVSPPGRCVCEEVRLTV